MKSTESAGGTDPGVRMLNQAVLLRASGQEGVALAQFSKAVQGSQEIFVKYLAAVELSRKRLQ